MGGIKHHARTLHVANLDGIGHKVTCHVVDIIADIILPALVTNGIHLPHALRGFWFLIQLYHLGGVFLPAVQPEPMNLRYTMHRCSFIQVLADSVVSNQMTVHRCMVYVHHTHVHMPHLT